MQLEEECKRIWQQAAAWPAARVQGVPLCEVTNRQKTATTEVSPLAHVTTESKVFLLAPHTDDGENHADEATSAAAQPSGAPPVCYFTVGRIQNDVPCAIRPALSSGAAATEVEDANDSEVPCVVVFMETLHIHANAALAVEHVHFHGPVRVHGPGPVYFTDCSFGDDSALRRCHYLLRSCTPLSQGADSAAAAVAAQPQLRASDLTMGHGAAADGTRGDGGGAAATHSPPAREKTMERPNTFAGSVASSRDTTMADVTVTGDSVTAEPGHPPSMFGALSSSSPSFMASRCSLAESAAAQAHVTQAADPGSAAVDKNDGEHDAAGSAVAPDLLSDLKERRQGSIVLQDGGVRAYFRQCEIYGSGSGIGIVATETSSMCVQDCSLTGASLYWIAICVLGKATMHMSYTTIANVPGCGVAMAGSSSSVIDSCVLRKCGFVGVLALQEATVELVNTGVELCSSGTNVMATGCSKCSMTSCTISALLPSPPDDELAEVKGFLHAAKQSPHAHRKSLQRLFKMDMTSLRAIEQVSWLAHEDADGLRVGGHTTEHEEGKEEEDSEDAAVDLLSSQSIVLCGGTTASIRECELVCNTASQIEEEEEDDDEDRELANMERAMVEEAIERALPVNDITNTLLPSTTPSIPAVARVLVQQHFRACLGVAMIVQAIRHETYVMLHGSDPLASTSRPRSWRPTQRAFAAATEKIIRFLMRPPTAFLRPQQGTSPIGVPQDLPTKKEKHDDDDDGENDSTTANAINANLARALEHGLDTTVGLRPFGRLEGSYVLMGCLQALGAHPTLLEKGTYHIVIRDLARVKLLTNIFSLRSTYGTDLNRTMSTVVSANGLAKRAHGTGLRMLSPVASFNSSSSSQPSVPAPLLTAPRAEEGEEAYPCVAVVVDLLPYWSLTGKTICRQSLQPVFAPLGELACTVSSEGDDLSKTPAPASSPLASGTATDEGGETAEPTFCCNLYTESNILRYEPVEDDEDTENSDGREGAGAGQEVGDNTSYAASADKTEEEPRESVSTAASSARDTSMNKSAFGLVIAIPAKTLTEPLFYMPRTWRARETEAPSVVESSTALRTGVSFGPTPARMRWLPKVKAYARRLAEEWRRVELRDTKGSGRCSPLDGRETNNSPLIDVHVGSMSYLRNIGNVFLNVKDSTMDLPAVAPQHICTSLRAFLAVSGQAAAAAAVYAYSAVPSQYLEPLTTHAEHATAAAIALPLKSDSAHGLVGSSTSEAQAAAARTPLLPAAAAADARAAEALLLGDADAPPMMRQAVLEHRTNSTVLDEAATAEAATASSKQDGDELSAGSSPSTAAPEATDRVNTATALGHSGYEVDCFVANVASTSFAGLNTATEHVSEDDGEDTAGNRGVGAAPPVQGTATTARSLPLLRDGEEANAVPAEDELPGGEATAPAVAPPVADGQTAMIVSSNDAEHAGRDSQLPGTVQTGAEAAPQPTGDVGIPSSTDPDGLPADEEDFNAEWEVVESPSSSTAYSSFETSSASRVRDGSRAMAEERSPLEANRRRPPEDTSAAGEFSTSRRSASAVLAAGTCEPAAVQGQSPPSGEKSSEQQGELTPTSPPPPPPDAPRPTQSPSLPAVDTTAVSSASLTPSLPEDTRAPPHLRLNTSADDSATTSPHSTPAGGEASSLQRSSSQSSTKQAFRELAPVTTAPAQPSTMSQPGELHDTALRAGSQLVSNAAPAASTAAPLVTDVGDLLLSNRSSERPGQRGRDSNTSDRTRSADKDDTESAARHEPSDNQTARGACLSSRHESSSYIGNASPVGPNSNTAVSSSAGWAAGEGADRTSSPSWPASGPGAHAPLSADSPSLPPGRPQTPTASTIAPSSQAEQQARDIAASQERNVADPTTTTTTACRSRATVLVQVASSSAEKQDEPNTSAGATDVLTPLRETQTMVLTLQHELSNLKRIILSQQQQQQQQHQQSHLEGSREPPFATPPPRHSGPRGDDSRVTPDYADTQKPSRMPPHAEDGSLPEPTASAVPQPAPLTTRPEEDDARRGGLTGVQDEGSELSAVDRKLRLGDADAPAEMEATQRLGPSETWRDGAAARPGSAMEVASQADLPSSIAEVSVRELPAAQAGSTAASQRPSPPPEGTETATTPSLAIPNTAAGKLLMAKQRRNEEDGRGGDEERTERETSPEDTAKAHRTSTSRSPSASPPPTPEAAPAAQKTEGGRVSHRQGAASPNAQAAPLEAHDARTRAPLNGVRPTLSPADVRHRGDSGGGAARRASPTASHSRTPSAPVSGGAAAYQELPAGAPYALYAVREDDSREPLDAHATTWASPAELPARESEEARAAAAAARRWNLRVMRDLLRANLGTLSPAAESVWVQQQQRMAVVPDGAVPVGSPYAHVRPPRSPHLPLRQSAPPQTYGVGSPYGQPRRGGQRPASSPQAFGYRPVSAPVEGTRPTFSPPPLQQGLSPSPPPHHTPQQQAPYVRHEQTPSPPPQPSGSSFLPAGSLQPTAVYVLPPEWSPLNVAEADGARGFTHPHRRTFLPQRHAPLAPPSEVDWTGATAPAPSSLHPGPRALRPGGAGYVGEPYRYGEVDEKDEGQDGCGLYNYAGSHHDSSARSPQSPMELHDAEVYRGRPSAHGTRFTRRHGSSHQRSVSSASAAVGVGQRMYTAYESAEMARTAWELLLREEAENHRERHRLSPQRQTAQVDRLYTRPMLAKARRELQREQMERRASYGIQGCTFSPRINPPPSGQMGAARGARAAAAGPHRPSPACGKRRGAAPTEPRRVSPQSRRHGDGGRGTVQRARPGVHDVEEREVQVGRWAAADTVHTAVEEGDGGSASLPGAAVRGPAPTGAPSPPPPASATARAQKNAAVAGSRTNAGRRTDRPASAAPATSAAAVDADDAHQRHRQPDAHALEARPASSSSASSTEPEPSISPPFQEHSPTLPVPQPAPSTPHLGDAHPSRVSGRQLRSLSNDLSRNVGAGALPGQRSRTMSLASSGGMRGRLMLSSSTQQ